MSRVVYINVFERADGTQFLGEPHLTRPLAKKVQGPTGRFYFGSRPIYRLCIRLKDAKR